MVKVNCAIQLNPRGQKLICVCILSFGAWSIAEMIPRKISACVALKKDWYNAIYISQITEFNKSSVLWIFI